MRFSVSLSQAHRRGGRIPFEQMAETLPKEGISARLAEIRGQLKLLSDYL
jgi:hypothetical protein